MSVRPWNGRHHAGGGKLRLASSFSQRYPASTTFTAAGCANACHGGSTSTFNSYGRDLRLAAGTNDQRLAAIENLDSDKEGNSNLVEITKNAQPGWCVATTAGCDNNGRTPPASVALLDPPSAWNNQPPVANAGGPSPAAVGAPVTLNGSASRDPDGSIASYAWTFGNGTSGSGVTPSATYATAGTFTVTLTVTDNGGATNRASTTVTVTPNTQPPVAKHQRPLFGHGQRSHQLQWRRLPRSGRERRQLPVEFRRRCHRIRRRIDACVHGGGVVHREAHGHGQRRLANSASTTARCPTVPDCSRRSRRREDPTTAR